MTRGLLVLVFVGFTVATASAQSTGVIVNGAALSRETLAALQQMYPVPIPAGRYWYDDVSGVYGMEGGPVAGQMSPGLRLGGRLRADASRGTSGVFVNGRQLTNGEKMYIERACRTYVAPGRYYVNALGLGGFEGGPITFNLALCGPPPGRARGGSSTRTYCDANGACTSSGILGTITTVPY